MKKILLFCMLLLITGKSFSQLTSMPASAQAIIFKKVFTYIRTLHTNNLKVLVVYDEGSQQIKNEIVKAFENENINVTTARADKLPSNASDIAILYIVPGVNSAAIRSYCAENNILSITGDPDLVMKGYASIGIGNAGKDSRREKKKILPRILLNLSQLQDESQEISELLSLDSIIKIK